MEWSWRTSHELSAIGTTRSSAWCLRSTCWNRLSTKRLFDIEDRYTRKFNFSHLYTALSRSQYMGLPGSRTRVGAS